jgi:DNA-binding transcriptional LysR family regulator
MMPNRSAPVQTPGWDDLRVLLAIARTGSLSAAGRTLRIDQTTVARRLAALEARLGALLVMRGSAGTELTAAGRRALAVAEDVEAKLAGLEATIDRADERLSGTVRITLPSGFVAVILPALARLSSAHPRLAFDLLTSQARLNLVQREADLALRMTPESQPSLVARKLGDIPWGLYASSAYVQRKGVPPPGLGGHDLIGFVEPVTRTPGGVWIAAAARDANIVIRVADVFTGLFAAEAGLGLVVAPRHLVRHAPALVPVPAEGLGASPIFAVTHAELAGVPRVRTTIDAIAAHVATHADVLGVAAKKERDPSRRR